MTPTTNNTTENQNILPISFITYIDGVFTMNNPIKIKTIMTNITI